MARALLTLRWLRLRPLGRRRSVAAKREEQPHQNPKLPPAFPADKAEQPHAPGVLTSPRCCVVRGPRRGGFTVRNRREPPSGLLCGIDLSRSVSMALSRQTPGSLQPREKQNPSLVTISFLGWTRVLAFRVVTAEPEWRL